MKMNVIIVYNKGEDKILMCLRSKAPYKGIYNLVGGKIEQGEEGLESAYSELEEETGITQEEYVKIFGISRKTLYEIENELNDVKIDLVFNIAAHHNVFIEELFESKYRFNSITHFDFEEQDNKVIDMIYSFELNHDSKCTKFMQWYNLRGVVNE